MATYDVSPQRASLLGDATTLGLLPPELLYIIRDKTSPNFLDAVAEAALIPQLTGRIYGHFETAFADICARWLVKSKPETQDGRVIAAFARILPFNPSLCVLLDKYLQDTATGPAADGEALAILSLKAATPAALPQDEDLLKILLAIWRLLSFDKLVYSQLVPVYLQHLFRHHSIPSVRYLAIRIHCQVYAASDYKLESLLQEFLEAGESLVADLDGSDADFRFLSLYEHKRVIDLNDHLVSTRDRPKAAAHGDFPAQTLTPLVLAWGRTVIPRQGGPVYHPSSLVKTPTTLKNLEKIAKALCRQEPILVRGLPGSGKTSLILEAARELGKAAELVTIHLNEQTDAKLLIGLYTTGSKPGSFHWRQGILTTAVKEGRWLLIEDLDRAPNELLSTILPLIERRELIVPNRSEAIKAPRDFRIFATVRTALGLRGQETARGMLSERCWQSFTVDSIPQIELCEILQTSFPSLGLLIPDIVSVYDQVTPFSRSATSADRTSNPRDLIKWCQRVERMVGLEGNKGAAGLLTDTTWCSIFLDAVDCFVGSVKDERVRQAMARRIGRTLRMSTEALDHALAARVPQFVDGESQLVVGRAALPKARRSSRATHSRKPFAATTHAKRLLEQVSVAVGLGEPILLVGETGIGKTAVVQQLAAILGHKLVVVNLSQQSEVGDLLGGFKPVNVRSLALPLKEEFEDLFAATEISTKSNQKYLAKLGTCIAKGKWSEVSKLWQQAPKIFEQILNQISEKQSKNSPQQNGGIQPPKRRKTRLQVLLDLKPRWDRFSQNLEQFDIQLSGGSGNFAFTFAEGKIVKAVRNGDWVLLDEINLASPDTLESIADLLGTGPGGVPSILLSETGEVERIKAHPSFRIFGAMNPATDVGKRDLPIGLRSRFTELFVASPDQDRKDLSLIVETYLKGSNSNVKQAVGRVVNLYLAIKSLADDKSLVDGANDVPHFSLRTLTRVLTYVNEVSPYYGLDRALFEGFCMGFLTLLSQQSEDKVMPLISSHLFGDGVNRRQSVLSQPPKYPNDGREYVRFMNKDRDRQYWLTKGPLAPQEREDYIRTPYVERNLLNLVRATSTRLFPILIQGPTSSGKTSMIEYLASISGNKFVRINNHEHTDLQEYLGTYLSGPDGKLKFQEGALAQAMRQGHWIVLDELNLAPTDVLEAMNRLLDDNRELLIPETQEVIRPHENFMLFATQNPPGIYGGRKVLSRAFRNRFLELHFDDIPQSELESILQQRCVRTAPSDCRRIVAVYKELSRLRQTSRVFEQKNSFATLRDLFRWALRDADNREQIAYNGFMLLAERVRDEEERIAVKCVIETAFKVKLDPKLLYCLEHASELRQAQSLGNSHGVVWTSAMRRLYLLVARALRNREPVLLVGETGCGKTTVCQILAEVARKELHIVNAHQNTETGDLIGSQRPVRNRGAIGAALQESLVIALQSVGKPTDGALEELYERYRDLGPADVSSVPREMKESIAREYTRSQALFEWCDGSLVRAMKTGQYFLLDEISLADDSVLERLNSVLEPQRRLLLVEKGIQDAQVQAVEGFQFFATMNPGGDFGKKELSPALRNRFTEIWVPPLTESEDIRDIVVEKLNPEFTPLASTIVEFSFWFGTTFRTTAATPFSIREILMWVKFINQCSTQSPMAALVHGAATVFIDTLGASPSAMVAIDPQTMKSQRQKCLDKLEALLQHGIDVNALYKLEPQLTIGGDRLQVGDFSIGRSPSAELEMGFEFEAPTTKMNAARIVRALQLDKPILLEGNPGVGKTTLVSALARAAGQGLTRINLSDQTDLMDLFGTDVPVEGAEAGHFAWRDAPFLQAMQRGEWVLLDEMNLASQSVLEGLNACLDHRGEVYISELDQVFRRHPSFRLFAAQNPHHQGGGRKGLPSSFVNRFIVVYADVFTVDDQLRIAGKRCEGVSSEIAGRIINFISTLEHEIVVRKTLGAEGSPWEFNLRDTLRWLELASSRTPFVRGADVEDFLGIIVQQRFRNDRDRAQASRLFNECFQKQHEEHSLYHAVSSAFAQVGLAFLQRNLESQPTPFPGIVVQTRLAELESVMICIQQNLPCVLVGPSGSGKSALLQHVAALAGRRLVVFSLNADVDTLDLVGGFEQADPMRDVYASLTELRETLQRHILVMEASVAVPDAAVRLMRMLQDHCDAPGKVGPLAEAIQSLAPDVPAQSELASILSQTFSLLQCGPSLDKPRFEWLDGIIVRAVQNGEWLVLDNANLCNASVLDRLNSLLERPNGFLGINEHSEPDGSPRVVTPHPDFRVFLTMDPKHGELSRAMRNRSVEIYLDVAPSKTQPFMQRITPVESSLLRYNDVLRLDVQLGPPLPGTRMLSLDNLSLADSLLLADFARGAEGGLMRAVAPKSLDRSNTSLQAALSYLKSPDAEHIRRAISRLSTHLAERTTEAVCNVGGEGLTPNLISQMQPLQPLQNSPALRLLNEEQGQLLRWLSICHGCYFELYHAHQAMQSQLQTANTTKPLSLNRLQRSSIAHRVATVSGDSTVKVEHFLRSILHAIDARMREEAGDPATGRTLGVLFHYWRRTYELASRAGFDEVEFQAHLSQGTKMLTDAMGDLSEPANRNLVATVLQLIESDFIAGFQRTTGLSLESLWQLLRPTPICSQESLEQVGRLGELAVRFDMLRWRAPASATDMAKVMFSLAQMGALLRTDASNAGGLLQALEGEIQSLEARVDADSNASRPVLAVEFEALRQVLFLHHDNLAEHQADILVLSDVPTGSLMRLQSSSGFAKRLQAVDFLLCQDSETRPWSGLVSASLLEKYESVSSSSLLSLRSLEAELPLMGATLARSSHAISSDSLTRLNHTLWELLLEVVASHDASLKPDLDMMCTHVSRHLESASVAIREHGLVVDPPMPPLSGLSLDSWPRHLAEAMEAHFGAAIIALTASKRGPMRYAFAAIAWVQVAIGCIKLYTPDKVFDPHLKSQMEGDFFNSLKESMQRQLSALRDFYLAFTGQPSSLRARLLEEDVESMGTSPPTEEAALAIYRPPGSTLQRIQKELFNPVLDAVLKDNISSSHYGLLAPTSMGGDEELALMEGNVSRLIQRLSSQLTAYDDLTVPLVNLLRCLQLGLSLTGGKAAGVASYGSALLQATPFVGGSLTDYEQLSVPSRSLEFLHFTGACVSIDGVERLSSEARKSIYACFHFFYEEWSKKLDADRKAEEARTSLYRFRGSADDEEEVDQQEFNELFPDYDADIAAQPNQPTASSSHRITRDLSVKLAEIHGNILHSPRPPLDALKDFSRTVARIAVREKSELAQTVAHLDRDLLPTTVLALEDKLREFKADSVGSDYNFYTDANLPEAHKIVGLVSDIQSRFRRLQQIDEIGHLQPLADVLMACDMVLELGQSDPLAKVLPRVEKLHEFVYEWQFRGYASHQHTAPALYDRLTATIVWWRKAELSTWSKLFDMEARKCRQDASSWWFVAYQAVVAGPLAVLDSEPDAAQALRSHSAQLLQELETYVAGAFMGQFGARLDLLRQLLAHLELLVLDYPALAVVCNAVHNFIAFYSRFEAKVAETVQKSRGALQKKMQDVVLLASWKDTNIAALRESARKSHQKLFRLVRKFRAVLGQPIRAIVSQGLPDVDLAAAGLPGPSSQIDVDPEAAKICQRLFPRWDEDAHCRRLSNVDRIMLVMDTAASLPESAIQAPTVLDHFLDELLASIISLRKATPGLLTDDNKDVVKHLKTQKAKLLSDTLKNVRQMGFSRNLVESRLAAQKSLSVIFSRFGRGKSCRDERGVDYYFDKLVDVAPRFRTAIHDHHEDVSLDAARRSVGYLEGILFVALQQREMLSVATQDLEMLESGIATVKELGFTPSGETIGIQRTICNSARAIRWLVHILQFALDLVDAHARLGAITDTAAQDMLRKWHDKVSSLHRQYEALPQLPNGFTSSGEVKLQQQVDETLQHLQADLDIASAARPDLTFVFQQVNLWTTTTSSATPDPTQDDALAVFTEEMLTMSKKTLDAVQKFKSAVAPLPTSADDPAWLVHYSTLLSAALQALHMDTIARDVVACIAQLKHVNLDDAPRHAAAAALLRLLLPLLQQFASVCRGRVRDFAQLHAATCRMGFRLGQSFIEISAKGFCAPQEKSDDKSADKGELESGTGLGGGEGAEDISKDVQPDEDLTELAQEGNKEESGGVEEEKEAVDMGGEELEGEMGSVGGDDEEEDSGSEDEKGDEEEMEDEVGAVDDLDPTAVDEKMWDGDGDDDAEKEQQGNKSKGQKKDDEQAAVDSAPQPEDDVEAEDDADQGDADEAPGPEDEDVRPQEELNRQDQNVPENEALALPDDMEMDIDDKDGDDESGEDDDDLDSISEAEGEDDRRNDVDVSDDDAEQAQQQQEGDEDSDAAEEEAADGEADDGVDMDLDEQGAQEDEDDGEGKEDKEKPLATQDNANADPDGIDPSQAQSGLGQAGEEDEAQKAEPPTGENANQDQGQTADAATDQDTAPGDEGAMSRRDGEPPQADQDQTGDSQQEQPFKKLGDMLEHWHRHRRDIRAAEEAQQHPQDKTNQADAEAEAVQKEFQHLQDENAPADAQALGTATDEEVKPLDESMAIDDNMQDDGQKPHVLPEADDEEAEDGTDKMDVETSTEREEQRGKQEAQDERTGVSTRQGAYDKETSQSPDADAGVEAEDSDSDSTVEETSTQLSATHLTTEGERPLRDYNEALQQWTTFQTKTHALSLSLTSQLRLILTPSQSTKLSGAFRTGKRLNIKKVIPYIASGFKRDKIWTRRAVPTKRAYQILLCVDDSRSMAGPDGAGPLALESLVMVARALALLEAGQVGVLGFGATVFSAHDLPPPSSAAPFAASPHAGAQALRHFSFAQDRTDMALLLRATIDRFRAARSTAAAGPAGAADLWQLALVLSDGLTPSAAHEPVRRLLREAAEARVMVVFIVLDDASSSSGAGRRDGVLELKEARFVKDAASGEDRVVVERYLDSFPFPYYLIVHHLQELPGALAALLRTWFAEVNA